MTAQTAATAKDIAIHLTKTPSGFADVDRILVEGTQLSVIEATNGAVVLQSLLVLLLTDFNNSLNVVRPLTDYQIADLAQELSREYWEYTLEDFICFFHLAAKGALSDTRDNQIRDRIDKQIINSLLLVYDRRRLDKIRELNDKYKIESPDPPGKTIPVSGEELLKWIDNPPSREEVEERLGRKLTEEEWIKAKGA